MHCQNAPPATHALQQPSKRRIRKWLAGFVAGEYEAIIDVAIRLHSFQDYERAGAERLAMQSAALHALARHGPGLVEQIKLRPPRKSRLAAPSGRQNGELQRPGSRARLLAQCSH